MRVPGRDVRGAAGRIEDTTVLPDGALAADNDALVSAAVALVG